MTAEKIPLFLDTETYCETPINHGTHRYAEGAEVIMWQWAVGLDGELVVRDGDENVDDLLDMLGDDRYEIVIHNSAFDRTVTRHARQIVIPVQRVFDTMVCAQAHSLPGSLGALCEVLRIPTDKAKDKEGKAWISLFCKPQPKGRAIRRCTRETHPVEWQRFRAYGGLDVLAMREVYKKLPKWNYKGFERELWHLDQKINERGVLMDQELAVAAVRACERAQKGYRADAVRMTDGQVESFTQRDKLLEHLLGAFGVLLPDLQISTLERRIEDPDLPQELRDILAVRLQASKSSASKYKRVISGVSADGRLRGLLVFCGAARTGRWAGRLFQPQNCPRPTMKNAQIERGIEALKANAEDLI